MKDLNCAQKVIEKFGGQAILSGLIGKNQSTISYWSTKGSIPSRWHGKLLQLAATTGIDLTPGDLIPAPEVIEVDVMPDSNIPRATHWGELEIGKAIIPCYVLDNGTRVFSLKGIVVGLIGTEGGQLAEYMKVKSLQPYLPPDLVPAENGQISALFRFDTGGESFAKFAQGLKVERFMDLCIAYSTALQEHMSGKSEVKLTTRQLEIAVRATAFLHAAAKTGIIALVDEATGYQYDRAEDALRLKVKLFIEDEMRKWEKTFPDQLWAEFGRLTHWKGTLHQRPKYWGKLVMELIYEYLDPDVAKWLKENKPKPMAGQNYHQWLTSQYGLKRLVEHIWMLIGMASTCATMRELRERMAEKFGRQSLQLTLYVPSSMTNQKFIPATTPGKGQ